MGLRGGYRPGAGRKPGALWAGKVVRPDRDPRRRLPPAVTPDEAVALVEPPAGLSPEEAVCWRECAPLAVAALTLTPANVQGFRELCTRLAYVRLLDERIRVLGIATQDALRYSVERRGWGNLLTSSLKDFQLTAFGKPATSTQRPVANPFMTMAK